MNPLKHDPTKTTLLRKQFSSDLTKRFNKIKGLVNHRIESGAPVTEDWLRQRLELEVLSVDTDPYIKKGYGSGRTQAYRATKRRSQLFLSGEHKLMAEGLFFSDNPPTQLLGTLQTRTKNELKGIVDAVVQQSSRVLSDSELKGLSQKETAALIKDRIDKIGSTRSKVLVESEIIRSHAEGSLDTMESLGVQHISVNVEWTTRGDAKVCPLCAPLQGIIMTIKQARGIFPRHPRCRCSPIPAPSSRRINKRKLKRAVSKSVKAQFPKKKKSKKKLWKVK